jgi:hypothetical protein
LKGLATTFVVQFIQGVDLIDRPNAAGAARTIAILVVVRDAGLAAGDDVVIRAAGSGRIEVEHADDLIKRFAGTLPRSTYQPGYLDGLRDEWRR